MAFARAQGLPLDKVVDTLGKGAGSSWYFVHRAPNMVRGAYPAGFRVRLHAKDLGICRDMAARFGVTLPVVERMLDEYAELVSRGYRRRRHLRHVPPEGRAVRARHGRRRRDA